MGRSKQLATLIDSAPATLDTLNELASALGDDANFSTTVTSSIATKLPLAGGTMTGAISMSGNQINLAPSSLSDATISFNEPGDNIVIRNHNASGTANSINIDTRAGSVMLRHVDVGSSIYHLMVEAKTNGSVDLYYDNSKKLETTTNGISVTGNVGIGTASPQDLLHLTTLNSASHIRLQRLEQGEALDDGDEIGGIEFWANDGSYASNVPQLRAAIRAETQNTSSGTRLEFWTGNSGSAVAERMRIIADGKVGIGTDSPGYPLQVNGSVDILNVKGSTGNAFVRFTDSDATADFSIGADDGSSAGAGAFILYDRSNSAYRLTVNSSGLVEVASYLKSKKGTIQTVVNQPTIYASINPVQVWAEASSSFRVSITPRFASGTKILGTYSIPINPTGASNILMAIQPWYSTDGGTTKTVLNQGGPYGSRITGSHAWFRSSNGYDINDMQNHVVHFGFTPGATTTMTWGFYFRSEGGNTTYFCSSQGNSSLWGWTAPVYMELREVEIA
jgi:hypothetical protein